MIRPMNYVSPAAISVKNVWTHLIIVQVVLLQWHLLDKILLLKNVPANNNTMMMVHQLFVIAAIILVLSALLVHQQIIALVVVLLIFANYLIAILAFVLMVIMIQEMNRNYVNLVIFHAKPVLVLYFLNV